MNGFDREAIERQLLAAGCDTLGARKPRRGRAKQERSLFDPSGGHLTNRPPANSNAVVGGVSCGGEDTATLSLYVRWRDWERFAKTLDQAKEAAGSPDKAAADRSDFVVFNRREWQVMRQGHRAGGDRGPMFRWCLKSAGVTLSIAKLAEPHGESPNVMLTMGSIALMESGGLLNLWPEVKQWLEDMGAVVVKDKISRVDVCVDLPGVHVSALATPFSDGHYISRARKSSEFESLTATVHTLNRKSTGFTLGSKDLLIRGYDKLAEVKKDPVKLAAMIKLRWGGIEPQAATRVEFQLRREKLKELGVTDVASWAKLREGVCAYLTNDWLRFTDREVDRTNTTRAAVLPLWERVASDFVAWSTSEVKHVKREWRSRIDFKQLRSQMIGCAATIVAGTRGVVFDAGELLSLLFDEIEKGVTAIEDSEWVKRLARKRSRFDTLVPDD